MKLTDDELYAVYGLLCDEYYYGRELMYQATKEAEGVRSALDKIDVEFEKRKL